MEVPVAITFRSRLLGLALLARRNAGSGLLIPGCRSVHTIGMRFRIDVHFLDDEERVVRVVQAVSPWRTVACAGASSVLELPVAEPEPRPGTRRASRKPTERTATAIGSAVTTPSENACGDSNPP